MANLFLLCALLTQEWTEPAWQPNEGWKLQDGVLERVAKVGTLWSRDEYGDFILRLDYKLPVGGNSGILFRSRDNVEHQIELLGNSGGPVSTGCTGSIFRRAAPTQNTSRKPGEWNTLELEVRGRACSVMLNGTKVIDSALVDDLPFRGPIGLQEHGSPLWFRNVKIQHLSPPAPPRNEGPLSAEETRAFMKRLARYVEENHLKKDPKSEQKGMVYEYFDTKRKGEFDQWVQGEALDTMHDGAWFGVALVNAARATGDPAYTEFLAQWTVPFYCTMLNRSDTLFSAKSDDSDASAVKFGREHQLQEGEKGFAPYWWDDGASVSLERRRTKTARPAFSATDRLAGKSNPTYALSGWSHGSSNHLAQDLAVLLQEAWLHLRESHPKLAADVAEAAKNLHESRMRHHGVIPAVAAAAGLTHGDRALLERVGLPREGAPIRNHYVACLAPPDPSKTHMTPAFADDEQYQYSLGIARAAGDLPRPLAFQLVYNSFTNPMLFRYHHDTGDVPPGINRFDLQPIGYVGGKPAFYRSTRAGGIGPRFGPQNMIICGLGLQALKAYPGLWEERIPKEDLRVGFLNEGRHYTVSGHAEGGATDPLTLGPATVRLVSHRSALLVAGAAKGESVTLRIHAQPDGKGSHADVTLRRDRTWSGVNDAGDPLRVTGHVNVEPDGFVFEFALPYTVVKDQKPWANGVELGRYTISVGDARRNFVLASSEEQVRRALQKELGEGLRTWRAIFDERGYLPTGINAGGDWERYSDTGGYAHLLSAGAQWLIHLDGKRDWQLHRIPKSE